ncbi:DUF3592 domain-containing protein [Hyalangium rubrum]|uniref:DUF3592 domain-containing protein n=1 Tax=Hyalangium rubrum TaxID=3103134 RepID=A0ABU5HJV7_9BACT|nr:DUF3592 domain-containing protein [Hyalangium sp. s54d21]MDY7233189.1 DUF3592 domain-containing protein [Hyalangium sp. s54d21]
MKSVLLGLAMLVFGGALAFGGGRTLYRAHASRSWPVVEGSVVSSVVETVRNKRAVSFQPHVRYRYTVDGASYTSENISFGGGAAGETLEEANAFVRRLPEGAPVQLHYAPGDASLVCLDCQRVSLADYGVTGGGAVLVGLAVLSLVETARFELRMRRLEHRASLAGGPGRRAS